MIECDEALSSQTGPNWSPISCMGEGLSGRFLHSEIKGRLTGFEPATSWTTTRCSTPELQPPLVVRKITHELTVRKAILKHCELIMDFFDEDGRWQKESHLYFQASGIIFCLIPFKDFKFFQG